MQKLRELWDSVRDGIFCRAIILFALLFLLLLVIVEKLLPDDLASSTPEEYREYARRNPVKAWFFKWPLRLVAM